MIARFRTNVCGTYSSPVSHRKDTHPCQLSFNHHSFSLINFLFTSCTDVLSYILTEVANLVNKLWSFRIANFCRRFDPSSIMRCTFSILYIPRTNVCLMYIEVNHLY